MDVLSLLLGRLVAANEGCVQDHRNSDDRHAFVVSFDYLSTQESNLLHRTDKHRSCIAFAGVHVHYMGVYEKARLPAVTIIQPLIWQNLSLTWALLSAMAVALKPFLKDFHTGMGMDLGHVTESNYGSASKKYAKQGYLLQNMSPNRSKDSKAPEENVTDAVAAEGTRHLTEGDQYAVEISHGRKPSLGTLSMRSDDPIIRKQVDYDVTYDTLKTV